MEKLRVLVAEDEALLRLNLVESLTELGYDVCGQAVDGIEAVQLSLELEPDVVLIDIKMPNMDGLAATREIAALGKSAVLILTAFSQRELITEACEAGSLAYLVKPYSDKELVPAIELAVHRHKEQQYLSTKVESLSEKLEARKVMDKAKGVLMDKFSMTENEAFRFIQKTAMSTRATMLEVSTGVTTGELSPGKSLVS